MILVSTIGFFRYAGQSGVVNGYIRHCIVGKNQDVRYFAKDKQ